MTRHPTSPRLPSAPRPLRLAMLGLLCVPGVGQANDVWDCTSGFWDVAACWADGSVPVAGDDVLVDHLPYEITGDNDTVVMFDAITGNRSAKSLTVNETFGGITETGFDLSVEFRQSGGTLSLSGGDAFEDYALRIGQSGTGGARYSMTGGTLLVDTGILVGATGETSARGNLSVSNGTVVAGRMVIGDDGRGFVDHSGGSISVGTLALSNTVPSDDVTPSARYTLSGSAMLATANTIVSGNPFVAPLLFFKQNGGTHQTDRLHISSPKAVYQLTAGLLDVAIFSSVESGSFVQNGGTHQTPTLYVAQLSVDEDGPVPSGYILAGGTLTTDSTHIGWLGGSREHEAPTFLHSGGAHETGYLAIGTVEDGFSYNFGKYHMSGGTLSAATTVIGEWQGKFEQTGGAHVVGSLSIGVDPGPENWPADAGTGSYTLSGTALLDAGVTLVGSSAFGSFLQSGGTHQATTLIVADGVGSTGSYALDGTLTAHALTIGNEGAATFTQTGGSLSADNAIQLAMGAGSSAALRLAGGNTLAGSIVTGAGASSLVIDQGFLSLSGGFGDLGVGALTVGENYLFAYHEQAGGVTQVDGALTLGAGESGGGGYVLGSGTLVTGTVTVQGVDSYIGHFAGTHTTGSLDIGVTGRGSYGLFGGTLAVQGDVTLGAGGSFTQQTSSATLQGLIVDGASAPGGLYELQSGMLASGGTTIGRSGYGRFVQSGGTFDNGSALVLGELAGSDGSYSLTAGGTILRTHSLIVGQGGTGSFLQQAGSVNAGNALVLGESSGAYGSYTLLGGGISAAASTIGDAGDGSFVQRGGDHDVATALFLATAAGSTANYRLEGGTLNADYIQGGAGVSRFVLDGGTLNLSGGSGDIFDLGELVVGDLNNESHTQNGGSFTLTTGLTLGLDSLATGNYTLAGSGNLNSGTTRVGVAGDASFLHQAGMHASTATLLGGAAGSVASYTQNGGTHSVQDTLTIAAASGASATYRLNGGTLAAGTIALNAGGSFLQAAGDLSYDLFIQQGGLLGAVTHVNATTYDYRGGTISGRFVNDSTLLVNANLTLGNGLENNGSVSALGVGRSLTANGTGLVNNGQMTLAGGTLGGNGLLHNAAQIEGFGTITGTQRFTNSGLITQSAGNLTFANSNGNENLGNIDLQAGRQLRLNGAGASLTNYGTINLNGASVTGTGQFTNGIGGTLSGRGTIAASFVNAGLLQVLAGTTQVSGGFENFGLISLTGDGASLAGGTIDNFGTIEGAGQVGNKLVNGIDGTVEARGGTLTVSAAGDNLGTYHVASGAKLLFSNSLAANAGTLSLAGGTLDTNGRSLHNTGLIAGHGTFRSGGLQNAGTMAFTQAPSQVFGAINNLSKNGLIVVSGDASVTFHDDLINNGEVRTSLGSSSIFIGDVSGSGQFSGGGAFFFEGTLNPGNSPGYIAASGAVSLGTSSTAVMEIAGLGRGTQYDAFDVLPGTLSLNGTLIVELSGGYSPLAGASFDLFRADTIDGLFTQVVLPEIFGIRWQLSYLGDAIGTTDVLRLNALSAAPVPLPGAFWLLAAGLGGVLGRRHAKR